MISLLGIGDNTVDRYVDQGMMYPGGNAVNVAVHARRLGHKSSYLGCLANDDAGMLIYNSLLEEGVDVSRTRQIDGENAFCNIRLVDGERVFGDFSEGVVDQLKLNEKDLAFMIGFDVVHTSVYSFLDNDLAMIRSRAKYLSYDFSNEWDQSLLAEILPMLDFALISNSVQDIRENADLLKWASAQGSGMVMTTSGEKGAAVYDGKALYFQAIIPADTVVDTLGAGDAFAACFLTQVLEYNSIKDALQAAALYAAKTCGSYGAFGYGTQI